MTERFSNGNRPFSHLRNQLDRTRSMIARVNRRTRSAINTQDTDLFQTGADQESGRLLKLMNEIQRTSGEITQEEFIQRDSRIPVRNVTNPSKNNDSLFQLSQRQLWSSFAREITKALKRNV